jgi:hypothetical protein
MVHWMSRILKGLQTKGVVLTGEILRGTAPYRRDHINRFWRKNRDPGRPSYRSFAGLSCSTRTHDPENAGQAFLSSCGRGRRSYCAASASPPTRHAAAFGQTLPRLHTHRMRTANAEFKCKCNRTNSLGIPRSIIRRHTAASVVLADSIHAF